MRMGAIGPLLALGLLAGTPAAQAQDGGFVAAALSRSTGVVGFAVGDSAAGAENLATAECQSDGAPDCAIALSGPNMCISLARATSRHRLGLGSGASRAASQAAAMSECAQNGATGCNIHDTYCGPSSLQ